MKGDAKMLFQILEKEVDTIRLGYYALTGKEEGGWPVKAVWTKDVAVICDVPEPDSYLSLPITVFLPARDILDEEGVFYKRFDTARITFDAETVNGLVGYVKDKLADNEQRSSYVLSSGTMSCGEVFEEDRSLECNVCISETADVTVRVIGKKIMVCITETNGSINLVKNEIDGSFTATIEEQPEEFLAIID